MPASRVFAHSQNYPEPVRRDTPFVCLGFCKSASRRRATGEAKVDLRIEVADALDNTQLSGVTFQRLSGVPAPFDWGIQILFTAAQQDALALKVHLLRVFANQEHEDEGQSVVTLPRYAKRTGRPKIGLLNAPIPLTPQANSGVGRTFGAFGTCDAGTTAVTASLWHVVNGNLVKLVDGTGGQVPFFPTLWSFSFSIPRPPTGIDPVENIVMIVTSSNATSSESVNHPLVFQNE